MKTIDKYLTMLVRGVIGVALIVLFVVAFSVIIGRIFFDASMGWSQDVIRLCFTYIIYLGAAYCVREKGHLNVDFVLGMMKPQVRKAVEFVINTSCVLRIHRLLRLPVCRDRRFPEVPLSDASHDLLLLWCSYLRYPDVLLYA